MLLKRGAAAAQGFLEKKKIGIERALLIIFLTDDSSLPSDAAFIFLSKRSSIDPNHWLLVQRINIDCMVERIYYQTGLDPIALIADCHYKELIVLQKYALFSYYCQTILQPTDDNYAYRSCANSIYARQLFCTITEDERLSSMIRVDVPLSTVPFQRSHEGLTVLGDDCRASSIFHITLRFVHSLPLQKHQFVLIDIYFTLVLPVSDVPLESHSQVLMSIVTITMNKSPRGRNNRQSSGGTAVTLVLVHLTEMV